MNISSNEGGLSNRIKSLVSVIRLSNYNKNEYKVYWKVLDSYKKNNHILNCSFNQLFQNNIEVNKINKKSNIYNSHCLLILEIDNLPKNFNNFKSNCSKKFSINDKFNRNIDFMYNKIPQHIKNEYIQYFKELKLIPELHQKVVDFSEKFNETTVSVHLRSWNRKNEGSRRDYLFNIKKFEKQMLNFKETSFYLASDSKEVIQYFTNKSELKDKIIIYPRKTNLDTSRDFPEGIQEDLIELYLLSKNNIIIGSHFSSYTEVAWWLAECPKDIIIL